MKTSHGELFVDCSFIERQITVRLPDTEGPHGVGGKPRDGGWRAISSAIAGAGKSKGRCLRIAPPRHHIRHPTTTSVNGACGSVLHWVGSGGTPPPAVIGNRLESFCRHRVPHLPPRKRLPTFPLLRSPPEPVCRTGAARRSPMP